MKSIEPARIQQLLDQLKGKEVYIHLEMTTGAYAAHRGEAKLAATAFITNATVTYSQGYIAGDGPYRVGLKTAHGWVFAQGLTHWDETETARLIAAGHDPDGKLVVALQIAQEPFSSHEED